MIIFTVHTFDFDDVAAEVKAAFKTRERAEQYVVDRINEVHDTAEVAAIENLNPSDTVFVNDQYDEVTIETTAMEEFSWVITAVELDI